MFHARALHGNIARSHSPAKGARETATTFRFTIPRSIEATNVLWLKAFHIVFVVTWFAGLFYLPRLFIYHAQSGDEASHVRFRVMERRLLAITNIGAVLALGFGLALLWSWRSVAPGYLAQGWLHAKLALVALLIGYHAWCARIARDFLVAHDRYGTRWLRWFNEVPALLLIGIVVLVVVKPF